MGRNHFRTFNDPEFNYLNEHLQLLHLKKERKKSCSFSRFILFFCMCTYTENIQNTQNRDAVCISCFHAFPSIDKNTKTLQVIPT